VGHNAVKQVAADGLIDRAEQRDIRCESGEKLS
jgi:hypothetical protein